MSILKTRFVFVDTSMYQNKNFHFHQHVLGRFKELCCDENIYLLMSPVVEKEVRSHLTQQGHEAANHIKEFKKTVKILRNLPNLEHHAIFSELKKEKVAEQLIETFDNFIEEAVHEVIDLNTASISTIIDNYFNCKPPFSEKKKEEFPDAIILESLLAWAKNKETTVYVLSTDGDMKSFCEASEGRLHFSDDLEKFISLVLTTEEKLSDFLAFAEEQYNLQETEIETTLEDVINSIEYSTVGYDIDDEVDSVLTSELSILERDIIRAEKDCAEYSLTLEFTAEAWHRLTDHSRSIWDHEEKSYMFTAQTSRKIRHKVKCKAYVWINFEFEDGLPVNPKLGDINIENSYIELDPDIGIVLECQEHEIFAA